MLRKSKPEFIKSLLGRNLGLALAAALLPVTTAAARPAAVVPVRVSSDTLVTAEAQHATQVEPDSFAFGSTVVSAFQVGRFFDGGASAIGFATSRDAGRSWRSGLLPGVTTPSSPPESATRATDPAVAFDAAHQRWLVASLMLSGNSTAIVISGSPNGLTWDTPSTAVARPPTARGETALDKSWIACDNGVSSPFRGRCYLAYTDAAGPGVAIGVKSSADGGLTWSTPAFVGVSTDVPGVQPVVRPNGELVIVFLDGPGWVEAVRSLDGGATFVRREVVSQEQTHRRPARVDLLRFFPLPSAEVDRAGTVYVAWPACTFRSGCRANDIVVSHSTNGGWTSPRRVRVPGLRADADHVLPGLAVDPATRGAHTRLAVTFYTLRSAGCASTSCLLDARIATSATAGARWSVRRLNTRPMRLDWLPQTVSGFMVGDYVSTSFSGGLAVFVFSLALPPRAGRLDQAIHALSLRVRSS